MDAYHWCVGFDYNILTEGVTGGFNLMPVGKLRNLQNRYGSGSRTEVSHTIWFRWFLLCRIFANQNKYKLPSLSQKSTTLGNIVSMPLKQPMAIGENFLQGNEQNFTIFQILIHSKARLGILLYGMSRKILWKL